MNKIQEDVKVDIGLVAQTLSNTSAAGDWLPMRGYRKALAILNGGAMAATKVTTLAFLQAQDGGGTGSKPISGKEGTIAANVKVTQATVDLTSVANTDVVTINGIAFTKAGSDAIPDRTFKDAAGLVALVNDKTWGVAGIVASANGAVVTLKADPKGEQTVTVTKTENAGTITLATVMAQALVEIEHFDLDHANGYSHVAIQVTTTGSTVVSAVLLRGAAQGGITQYAGAIG
jgi:hypothetical protein